MVILLPPQLIIPPYISLAVEHLMFLAHTDLTKGATMVWHSAIRLFPYL